MSVSTATANDGRGFGIASLLAVLIGILTGVFTGWTDGATLLLVLSPTVIVGITLAVLPVILYSRPHKLCWVSLAAIFVLVVVMSFTCRMDFD